MKLYLVYPGEKIGPLTRTKMRQDFAANHPEVVVTDAFFDSHRFYFRRNGVFLGLYAPIAP